MNSHFTTYGMISTFCNWGIKIPLLLAFTKKFRVCSRIAIFLAKPIFLTVFAFEVEDINDESYILKEWIIPDSLCNGTVVIEKDVIWLGAWYLVSSLDHLLHALLVRFQVEWSTKKNGLRLHCRWLLHEKRFLKQWPCHMEQQTIVHCEFACNQIEHPNWAQRDFFPTGSAAGIKRPLWLKVSFNCCK